MNRVLKMNRFFKSCLLASAGLVVLAVTLSFTASGRAVAQRVEEGCIRICDTASNPLHVIVQGITRVTGEVTINNENAIATTVTGPVQVSTSRGEPLLVVRRMKVDDIFQKQVSLTLKKCCNENVVTQDFVVPANKFLVIKHVSGTLTRTGQLYSASNFLVIVTVVQDNNSFIHFPLVPHSQTLTVTNGLPVSIYQIGGNQVEIIGTPTDTIRVTLQRLFGAGNSEGDLELAITGEYHDI